MAESGTPRKKDDPFEPSNQIGAAPLEAIVCTQELRNRPSRPPEYETENQALAALASALADSPRTILQTLADKVCEVLHADSAGLSLLTKDESRFYWAAVAGAWRPHIGADAPRNFGPCGDVLNHDAPMLFAHWERRYPYLSWAMPLADEGLLVPFYVNGKAVGTIWAVAHDNRCTFDAEDLRLLQSISRFASAAYQSVQAIDNLKLEVAAREKAETAVRELANELETQVRVRTQELERNTRDLLDSNRALEREITARVRTQQELERSKAFLVQGQHLSRTGTFSWHVATDEIMWSEQLYRIFEFDPGLPVTIERVRTRVYPEDLPLLEDRIETARNAASDFEYEHRLLMPDQSVKYVHLTAHPSRDVHGQLEYVGAAQDVTESKIVEDALRQSEERVHLIVDSIDGLVMTAGPQGEVESVNKQVLDYFGKSLEELKDWRTNDAIYPEDLPGALALWTHSVETGEPYHFDQRLRRADGAYRWFRVGGRSLCDAQGNVLRWYVLLMDIDERKRAEVELKRAYDSFADAERVSRTGSFTADIVADEHIWSAELYRIFEFDPATKIKVQMVLDVIHPEDLHSFETRFARSLAGADFDLVYRIVTRSGRVKYVRSIGRLIERVAGRPLFIGAIQDVTESKFAEEALRQSEERVRLIIDSIDGLVMTAGPQGEVESVNKQVLDYFGKSLEELKDWRNNDILHQDDRSSTEALWMRSVETGAPYDVEARFRRADAVYRWFRVSGRPMRDPEGNVLRWYVLLIDIDERKHAEAELKEAYLHLTEAQTLSKTGSFFSDLLVDHHTWSEEARRIFEFDPADKITVEKFRNKIHPEDLAFVDSVLARGMKGMDVNFSFRIVTSRGGVKHIRGYTRVVDQFVGRPLFRGALQDVTETKIAEEDLNKARSDLAHVTRVTTLNALTASIAHEVNQPLSGIVSNASASLRFLAGDAPNVEEAREAVRDIVRDGKRAGEIIARIRALTKRTAAPREKLDLNETISEVLLLIGDEAKRQSVIVRTQFGDSIAPVAGDRVQLQQVVLNLVMNAIEAMSSVSKRRRELVITTQNISADSVQATVEDSGTGIAYDTVDKIFDSFYTTKPGGMGMGLSISQSILKAHGGRLWAVSKDASGTMFHFTVPKYREEGAHEPATEA